MGKIQVESQNCTIFYEIKDEKAVITGSEGAVSRISLPASIEGYPVSAIDRKAFLSAKGLYGVRLPDSVEEIGDWAFAHCENLTEVAVPDREIRFGKAVFKNCGKLKKISKNGDSEAREGTGELLAAAVTLLDAYYLLDLPQAGSEEWLGRWDTRLCSVLRTADQEGYISQSVYGEEDYIGTDLEEYVSARRREKARLAFLRLRRPMALDAALKKELEEYLRNLTKGREGEEAWLVLKQEYGDEREYYELFAELGCVSQENLEDILTDIGEEYPEMKAFFLRAARREEADLFQDLEL